MKKIQFSKQNSKILSDKEINEKLIDTFMHKAKIVSGTLRCGRCNRVIGPPHSKPSCCKASYRRYMKENEVTIK